MFPFSPYRIYICTVKTETSFALLNFNFQVNFMIPDGTLMAKPHLGQKPSFDLASVQPVPNIDNVPDLIS
jgi:hypothetical protein